MRTNALHVTPHAGASCAPTRLCAPTARKNAPWRHEPRATPSPVHGARDADGTGATPVARVTATAGPTQSA